MSILPRPGSLYPPTPKSSSSSGSEGSSKPFMKCRLRYISFFAVGIDSRYLGIVSVLGPQSICHVIKVLPNASRLSDVLQEQIIVSDEGLASYYFKNTRNHKILKIFS